jgi:hypothetical protein
MCYAGWEDLDRDLARNTCAKAEFALLTIWQTNGTLLCRGGVVAEMRCTGIIELDLRKGILQGSAKSKTCQWCSSIDGLEGEASKLLSRI